MNCAKNQHIYSAQNVESHIIGKCIFNKNFMWCICTMFMLVNKQLHTQPSFLSDNPDTCNSNYSESFLFGIFFFFFGFCGEKLKKHG